MVKFILRANITFSNIDRKRRMCGMYLIIRGSRYLSVGILTLVSLHCMHFSSVPLMIRELLPSLLMFRTEFYNMLLPTKRTDVVLLETLFLMVVSFTTVPT